jgi:hypothetical protein
MRTRKAATIFPAASRPSSALLEKGMVKRVLASTLTFLDCRDEDLQAISLWRTGLFTTLMGFLRIDIGVVYMASREETVIIVVLATVALSLASL